jgi:hypothetical protein
LRCEKPLGDFLPCEIPSDALDIDSYLPVVDNCKKSELVGMRNIESQGTRFGPGLQSGLPGRRVGKYQSGRRAAKISAEDFAKYAARGSEAPPIFREAESRSTGALVGSEGFLDTGQICGG